MKKFLTVLLVIAVMFTFSFGSAFAADDVKDIKDALSSKSAELQNSVVKAGETYMESLNFDSDGYLTATTSGKVDSTYEDLFTKTEIQKRVNTVVDDAQYEIDKKATELQNGLKESDTKTGKVNELTEYYNTEILGQYITDSYILDGWYHESSLTYDKIAEKQYTADRDATRDLLNAYYAKAGDYSDDLDVKKYQADDQLVEKNNTGSTLYMNDYTVSQITNKTADQTAKDFVKNLNDHQLDEIDTINDEKTTHSYGTYPTGYVAALKHIADIRTMVVDIMEGHKIDTGADNYYVEAVPTATDSDADTTLADKKARAIREIKANLSAAAVKIETVLNDELEDMEKQADPDKEDLKDLRQQIADLDGQIAACEEVYTALINYADSKTEVDSVKLTINNEISSNLIISTYSDYHDKAEDVLEKKKDICDDVDDLIEEADLLKLQKDVNGKPLYDEKVLNDNLEDAKEDLYKGQKNLSQAKEMLAGGSEVALLNSKYNHIEFINGTKVGSFTPEDKNGKAVSASDLDPVTGAWYQSDATRTLTADEKVSVMKNYVVNKAGEVDLYDDAQQDELDALIEETEAAIRAAKTTTEVEDIFAAAHEKYKDIKTTREHFEDWAAGKTLGREYDDKDYDKQLERYIAYVHAKVDFTDDYYFGTMEEGAILDYLLDEARDIMYEAYTKAELADKFQEAKDMIDGIMDKTAVKAERKKVEDMIAALPSTITLADRDAIVAAADALDDYEDIIGDGLPSIINESKLNTAKEDYEELAADAIDDAYRALKDKKITVDDEAAIEALRDMFDDHDDFCEDYDVKSTVSTKDSQIEALEDKLSDEKVRYAKELMIKLPANPTASQRAQVEAARAYYEALDLDEQVQIVGTTAYKNLIDAEESLDVLNAYAVQALKITASSSAKKGSITVKWTVKGDAAAADGYQIWRSTKKNSGFKKMFTTTKTSYKNTKALKKGTRYYYKVRAYVNIDGKNVYSDWSNKAYRIAK